MSVRPSVGPSVDPSHYGSNRVISTYVVSLVHRHFLKNEYTFSFMSRQIFILRLGMLSRGVVLGRTFQRKMTLGQIFPMFFL